MKLYSLALSFAAFAAMASCTATDNASDAKTSDATEIAIENILTRTSVRQYQPNRTIGADTIEMILKAAMSAPTAVNKQPWEFVVLNNRATIDTLASALPYAKMLAQAPLAIVTCGNMARYLEGDSRELWIQDVSAATENLLLAVNAYGLGAVWTSVYPDSTRIADVSRVLNLPSTVIPLAVVPIGYPAGETTPKDKWDTSKVHYNSFK